MKKVHLALLCCAAFCLIFVGSVDARTYAGNLSVEARSVAVGDSQQITYHLNDDAASVVIEIKDSGMNTVRTLNAPGVTQGKHVIEWDLQDDSAVDVPLGSYTFSIATTDVGYATWTNITPYQPGVVGVDVASTTETVDSARFWSPNGLGVIKDKSDPNFGRIMVANGSSGGLTSSATGAYHAQSGVYFLNNDLSDTGEGWLESATDTLFNSASQYNPFKLNVDDERDVFVLGGYSDGWEDLYIVDMDGESYVTAFSRTDYASDPSNHDNMVHSAFTGVGASTTLWSNFEAGNTYPSLGSWETGWPITGAVTVPHTLEIASDAATNAENGIGTILYAMRTIVTTEDENYLFFSNRRWAADPVVAAKMDISGPTRPIMVAESDVFRSAFYGDGDKEYGNFNSVDIMVDPVDSTEKLVLQRYYGAGYTFITDTDFNLLDEFAPDPGLGTGTTGMCVFDPAGNVIYTSLTYEWLRVYAPPSAPFNFEIDYPGTFQVTELTGLSEEDWEVYR